MPVGHGRPIRAGAPATLCELEVLNAYASNYCYKHDIVSVLSTANGQGYRGYRYRVLHVT